MTRADVLFLSASPTNADQLQSDREARAIQRAIEDAAPDGEPPPLELVTRWASSPLDLLRELRKLHPAVLHFAGYGARGEEPGIYFQDEVSGDARCVRLETLRQTLTAVSPSPRALVLNAGHTAQLAEGLLEVVGCVIAIEGTISEEALRAFSREFYRALAEGATVREAWQRGNETPEVRGSSERGRPQLKTSGTNDAAWKLARSR